MKKSNRNFEAIIAGAEKQLKGARMAWVNATTPAAKALAQKAGEKAKAKIAEARQQMAATPVPAVVDPAAGLKARYHELKVRGEQKLFTEYKAELAAFEASLKEKYASKKKEFLAELLAAYKAELAGGTVAEVSAPAPAVQAPAVVEEEVSGFALEGNPCLFEEGEIFQIGEDRYLVKTASADLDEIQFAGCNERDAIIASAIKAGALKKVESVAAVEAKEKAKEEVPAKKAVLLAGSVFESSSGICYAVRETFDRAAYSAADAKEKQRMIQAAKDSGAIEKVEKQPENYLFECDEVTEVEEATVVTEAELPPTTSVSSPKAAETPSAAKKKALEVELTPEERRLEAIAAKALTEEGKKPSGLLHTGVSFEASGQKYEVVTVFDYFLFEAVGAVEKEVMIAAAVQGGAIKKAA